MHPSDPPLRQGAPPNPSPPPPRPPSATRPGRPGDAWVLLGCGVVAVVGSFLPWASVTGPFLGTTSVSGMDGATGWITVGLGVALISCGSSILRGRQASWATTLVTGLASLGLLVIGLWKIGDLTGSELAIQRKIAGLAADDVFGLRLALSQAIQVRVGIGLRLLPLAGLIGASVITSMVWARWRSARHARTADAVHHPNG